MYLEQIQYTKSKYAYLKSKTSNFEVVKFFFLNDYICENNEQKIPEVTLFILIEMYLLHSTNLFKYIPLG